MTPRIALLWLVTLALAGTGLVVLSGGQWWGMVLWIPLAVTVGYRVLGPRG